MKYLKMFSQMVLQFITAFLSILTLYFCVVLLGALIPSSYEDQQADVEIFIQSNGVHTDVVVPFKNELMDWSTFIDTNYFEKNDRISHIAFGWGDKGFFLDTPTWAELKLSTALNAIFLPSPCAMHVELKESKPIVADRVKIAHVDQQHYQNLVQHIQSSFVLDNERPIVIDGTSYWGTDRFFEAHDNYHMLNTCNSWTNGAIKSAGLKTASFAAFPNTVLWYR